MVTVEERIAAWLDVIPGAISGQGGHNQTFRVACQLYNGWGLSEAETLRWLARYNEKCEPAWTLAELKHKASTAAKAKHSKPRGHIARDAGFSTKPVPIRKPNNDSRLPMKGKLTSAEEELRVLQLFPTPNPIDKTDPRAYIRYIRKSSEGVADVAIGCLQRNRIEEKSSKGVADVPEQLLPEDLAEATRIAGELLKLRDAGAISSDPRDPEARFYARLLHTFGGEFIGK